MTTSRSINLLKLYYNYYNSTVHLFVLKGYTGGSYIAHAGAAPNYVCMPRDPTWNKYVDTVQAFAYMYGVEYFGATLDPLFGGSIKAHDIPCAVCRSTDRPTAMMLPARDVCYPGWHIEYAGYLMASLHSRPSGTEYICVDGAPEIESNDYRNELGGDLYTVESICGALPCGPYVNGRELTCSVCTK
jgi:hypothetical protein